MARQGTAEAFGWFGLARTAANVLGPLIGGAALAIAEPEVVYAATGVAATLAFLCVAPLSEPTTGSSRTDRDGLRAMLRALLASRPLMLIGAMEATIHVAIYAVKGFAPALALMQGSHPLAVGAFLATQEAVAAAARPAMGRLSDRTRPAVPMFMGMGALSTGLLVVAGTVGESPTVFAAALIGFGQGAFGPAALASVARSMPAEHHGLAYGAVGALRNAGKIAGPVAAGALTVAFSAGSAFVALSLVPLIAALLLLYSERDRVGRARA